ncbi:hypothetical protein [Caldicoprobacter faecalis]|uniref:Uncharacterized protein n=1 Tax=Caldicoprobacter faecalis TaxID=937334 RepID=A0A1I5XV15_9FIRM|nr:hypothetical protein [Caldicoprobacter faecalis]PZN09833.1 MAG: hypothetical protein DIU64_07685 [Caldicoprobacter oshimai]SFQ35841.1 hypothetical protein SAMN05444406_13112 [Caldicoprobacter faecalis]
MAKYVKYEMQPVEFKPVNYSQVRWLNQDDFHYMNEFFNMSIETWNEAKEQGYTYCAIIEEAKIFL